MKHIIFLDGTTNDLDPQEGESLTNIAKIFQRTPVNDQQSTLYVSGPGTRGNAFERAVRAAIAPERTISRIINIAGDYIKKNLEKGDEVHIAAFSRGAAIARRLASIIEKYTDIGAPPVYLWLFDTVASFGTPDIWPDTDVFFENATLAKHVRKAVHAVSVDEQRSIGFPVTLINYDARVEEVWFPGVHSSVGGGQPDSGLSDISLGFMIGRMRKEGVHIDDPDVPDAPDPLGPDYPIKRWWSNEREVCVWENDEPSHRFDPKVHKSADERIVGSPYCPPNLNDTLYYTVE